MKKAILKIIPIILLIMGCAGGAKPVESPANPADNSGVMTLDMALKEAAERIDERITAGSKIAPLNFNSPHDKFSGYVLDELTANLVDSRKLIVVDRKEVDLIRSEFDFQVSGEVGDDSMQELGRMLGAQSIISGSLTDLGEFYRIVIRVLNVQNASVEVQYRANVVSDAIVVALLTGGKSTTSQRVQTAQIPMASAVTSQPVPAPEQPNPVVSTTYKVGDRGPAGGIVFFDKGYYADGWRYLEAASQDVGIGVPWAASMRIVSGTSTAIGTGKRNSDLIRGSLEESIAAALVALHYSQGGYSDWYLPSKDELNLMYQNLKQNNLGGLNGWYWSSSDVASSIPDNDAWSLNFSNGRWNGTSNGDNKGDLDTSVRPIRQF